MMNMQEFMEYVAENIKQYLPDAYEKAEVTFEKVTKNNGKMLDALIIRKADINISPTLYMHEFFKEYVEGKDLREVLHEISETQQKYALDQSIEIAMLTDFSFAKEHIVPRLVNAKKNKALLKERPHTLIEDLAVIYQLEIGRQDDAVMSTAVHNKLLEHYGISVEELHKIALNNIEKVMHPSLLSMRDMLKSTLMGDVDEDMLPPEDPNGMHILTCESRNYGAAVALDEKTMEAVSEKFGNFYILPSSIHETIILPDDGSVNISELENLVKDVNVSQVAEQEVLSEHVYRYDKDTKSIKLASAA